MVEFVEFPFHALKLPILALVERGIGEFLREFGLFGFQLLDLAGQFIELLLLPVEKLPSLLDLHPFLRLRSRLRRGDDDGFCRFGYLALLDPILVAAGIFGEAPLSLVDDRSCHHVVEKGSVVGDKQKRSLVVHEEFLKEFQCLGIEIVSRFIEDENVGRLKEKSCQQESVSLAAREHLGRHADSIGGEEEIPQIAVDVAGASLKCDGFGFSGDIPSHALFSIDLIAQLVEVDDLKLGSQRDRS